ncbi:MAG: FxsA family protein [Pseudolabrys sp.]|nr:FxsA family protein [Pseudolabrys sp.]
MFVAKYLALALLALPIAELLVFILVASQIGFSAAAILVIATSALGWLVLSRAGGSHVERMKVVFGPQRVSAFQADARGLLVLIAGFLLLLPGFITDVIGLVLLIGPLRQAIGEWIHGRAGQPAGEPGVVDLAPEDYRRVPEERLTDRRE